MASPDRKNKNYHATSDDPGFMTAEDKVKADFITVTQDVNLDTIESSVTTLQGQVQQLGWADYGDDEYTSSNTYDLTANTTHDLPNNIQLGVRTYEPADITALGGYYTPTYLVVDDVTGFQVGETITGGTSTDTASIVSIDSSNNYLYLESIDGSFQDAETITGGTSSTTATVSGTRVPGKIRGVEGDGLNFLIDFKVKPTTASSTYIDVWLDIGGSIGELYRRTTSLPKGQNTEHGFTMSVGGYTLDTWESNGAIVYVRANAAVSIYDIRIVLTRTSQA
jgi:hypothetical protein